MSPDQDSHRPDHGRSVCLQPATQHEVIGQDESFELAFLCKEEHLSIGRLKPWLRAGEEPFPSRAFDIHNHEIEARSFKRDPLQPAVSELLPDAVWENQWSNRSKSLQATDLLKM